MLPCLEPELQQHSSALTSASLQVCAHAKGMAPVPSPCKPSSAGQAPASPEEGEEASGEAVLSYKAACPTPQWGYTRVPPLNIAWRWVLYLPWLGCSSRKLSRQV